MQTQGRYYDDLEVGDTIDLGGMSICDAHIVNFSGIGGDFYPVHTDDVAARALGFERRIAHGLMIVTMVDGMKMRCHWQLQAIATLSVTWDFRKPVLAGDRISATMRVESKRTTKRDDRGIIVFALDVRNQDSAVVLTGKSTTMMMRQTAGAASRVSGVAA